MCVCEGEREKYTLEQSEKVNDKMIETRLFNIWPL